MLMPFGAAFGTNNLGLTLDQLPLLYGVSGVFSIFTGPLIGKLSDQMGKMNIFIAGTLLSALMVGIYTRFDVTPFWVVVAINVVMFTGITARMISSTALVSAIPNPTDRGAFMSINSSIQQISGGIASAVAGLIVFQNESGKLMRYEQLGYVVIGTMLITIVLMGWIDRHVKAKTTQVAQSV
jgi:predicted MFS family arabinose efflux permease